MQGVCVSLCRCFQLSFPFLMHVVCGRAFDMRGQGRKIKFPTFASEHCSQPHLPHLPLRLSLLLFLSPPPLRQVRLLAYFKMTTSKKVSYGPFHPSLRNNITVCFGNIPQILLLLVTCLSMSTFAQSPITVTYMAYATVDEKTLYIQGAY